MFGRLLYAVFGHFRLKILALIIALGIWFYANSRLATEASVRATLEIIPPDHYSLLSQNVQTVRLNISGPQLLVTRVRNELAQNYLKLTYTLPEEDIQEGWALLDVKPEWLQPALAEWEFVQLKFHDVLPSTVKVFASPTQERELPVKVMTVGRPAAGFRLSPEATCTPATVTVTGPAVALGAMGHVPTEQLPVYGTRGDLYQSLSLQNSWPVELADGERIRVPLKLSEPSVLAAVYVTGETEQERTFADVPVMIMAPVGFPYIATLEDTTAVSVAVRTLPEELDKLEKLHKADKEPLKAFVDLSALAQQQVAPGAFATQRLPLYVQVPREIRACSYRTEPANVAVRLTNPAE